MSGGLGQRREFRIRLRVSCDCAGQALGGRALGTRQLHSSYANCDVRLC